MKILNIKNSYFIIALLALLSFSTQSFPGPTIKMCINEQCQNPVNIELSDVCWSELKTLFKSTLSTDKDEQDKIVAAIAFIDSDIYNTIASKEKEEQKADSIYEDNSSKNNYKNLKTYLGIMLDNHLINRHFMRKSITIKNWTGFTDTGILLQSLTDSKLYLLQKSDNLDDSAKITPYHSTK